MDGKIPIQRRIVVETLWMVKFPGRDVLSWRLCSGG